MRHKFSLGDELITRVRCAYGKCDIIDKVFVLIGMHAAPYFKQGSVIGLTRRKRSRQIKYFFFIQVYPHSLFLSPNGNLDLIFSGIGVELLRVHVIVDYLLSILKTLNIR